MFFHLSQALSWFVEPASWIFILALVALWLLVTQRYRAATILLGVVVVLCAAFFFSPLAGMLMRPLEQAFQAAPVLPQRLHGIVVLGGAENLGLSGAYGKPQLNSEAERLTEFVALAREHPEARLVFAGGGGNAAAVSPSEVTRQFLRGQGVDPASIIFEEQSRNTHESAVLARELAHPEKGEVWVLITSASHMRRAHGAFARAGWSVIPYPVSFRAMPAISPSDRDYDLLKTAVREWIGIAAYRLTGRM